MKRSILRAFALCLTSACIGSIASAQDDNTQIGRPSTASQTTPGVSSGVYGTSSSSHTTRAGEPVRLSKIMNTSLKSQSGESLGQVQDIVIDPSNGQIQFAVISLNGSATGAPGTGTSASASTTASGQLVAIPWRLVSSSGEGQFTATVDRSTLQSAPAFSSSSWPTMSSTWMQSVYSHFGVNANSTGAPGNSSGTGTGTGTGTGLGNPSTPGVPSAPGTPDISFPSGVRSTPSPTPSGGTGTVPGAGGSSPGGGK
jgi:sporulation protein YlmC with PRC-barrel domain